MALIQFCADYYHCPVGLAAAAALPRFFRRAGICRPPGGYRLCNDFYKPPTRRQKSWTIIELLEGGGVVSAAHIRRHIPNAAAELRRLLAEKIIKRAYLWDSTPAVDGDYFAPPRLTASQRQVLNEANCDGGFVPHLLLGATGSGKTEIYMRLADKVLSAGKQALVLTPEIHLTPQLADAFKRRFPNRRICVLHSGITDGERAARWMQALLGEADIILGTRLAVFTPLIRPGLIVMDEEQDDSYKQNEGMPFSARDVAVWRAKRENIPFIAGSATPSLESFENARRGKYQLLSLNERVHKAKLSVELIEDTGDTYHGLSSSLMRAVSDEINGNGQVLLFINRRGYSPALVCRKCHQALMCPNCNTRRTWHKRKDRLMCHWCNSDTAVPPHCPNCGGLTAPVGAGTERIEHALRRLFPKTKVTRLDSDSLGGGDFAKWRDEIANGKRRLLVGTRIIAKGHNLPRLSLIGILNTDNALFSSDFRAEERLLTMILQTIGRGTRNPEGCRIMVQTAHKAHPFYKDLLSADISGCWLRLLDERRRLQLPPFSHLALLKAAAKDDGRLQKFMKEAAFRARRCRPDNVSVYDPVPSFPAKIGVNHRRQMLLQSFSRAALHRFLSEWLPLPSSSSVRWGLDVDPGDV